MRRSFAAPPAQFKNTWLSTARGRVGYAFDRWLPYLTGGGAFGRVNIGNASGTVDETKTGWTAGVGLEYAFLGNWTAKIEYLHVDLGTATCDVSICTSRHQCGLHRRHRPRRHQLQVLRTDLQPLLISERKTEKPRAQARGFALRASGQGDQ